MTIRITDPSQDRYQRLRLIRWWDQEKIRNARVLVLGAGALGNEVVKNLALVGVGKTWIVDFDSIETSNLTRSALFRAGDVGNTKAEVLSQRANEMNPDASFQPLPVDARYELGLNFLREIDLVFGCLDNREARYFVNRACFLLRKPFIDGGLDTLNGSVTVFLPPETACYECTLSSIDRTELQKRISCLRSTDPEIKQHVPTAPTIASIIGGLQTQVGLRLLHGLDVPAGKRLGLYGLSDVFFDMRLEISEDCGMHATGEPLPADLQELPASESDPLHTVMLEARKLWDVSELNWDFDRDLFTNLACTSCGAEKSFTGTTVLFRDSATCSCGGVFKPAIATGFTGQEAWGNRSFRELGFPANHIYSAMTPAGRKYFHLRKSI